MAEEEKIENKESEKNTKRITATVPNDMFMKLQYWAGKKGISINQYLTEALESAIAYENQDYPLPTLEQARLNQLVDKMEAMTSAFYALRSVVTSGFDSLLTLTKGDNYLLNPEDGEL